MAAVVYLENGQEMPDEGEDQRWVLIHPSGDGLFFGSGGSRKATGEWVGYRSRSEDDVSLDKALQAAQEWAKEYNVPTIWVEAD